MLQLQKLEEHRFWHESAVTESVVFLVNRVRVSPGWFGVIQPVDEWVAQSPTLRQAREREPTRASSTSERAT